MQKRKLPRDANSRAAQIVAMSTGQPIPGARPDEVKEPDDRNLAARRRGGVRGGKARAEKLSKKKRAEIAKVAAAARWKKSD